MNILVEVYLIMVVVAILVLAVIFTTAYLLIRFVRNEPEKTKEETIPGDWWSGGFADNH
jgi:heme/copper-type cytochrome/quinol oxidase subunit 2